MDALTIDWYRVESGGETCDRCRETGGNLRALVEDLRSELADCGVRPELTVHELDADEVGLSNAVFLDGDPVESLVDADLQYTDCASCSDLLGVPTDCRAVDTGDGPVETLDPDLLRAAAFAAACDPGCCEG